MKIPSRTIVLLKLTVPLAAALTLTLIPPTRATSIEAKSAVGTPPEIETLVASSSAIHPGAAVKLHWSAPGATLVNITADSGSSPGRVPGEMVVVYPTKTTTYTVTAMNAAGGSVKTITIPVIEAEAAPAFPLSVMTGPSPSGLSQHHR